MPAGGALLVPRALLPGHADGAPPPPPLPGGMQRQAVMWQAPASLVCMLTLGLLSESPSQHPQALQPLPVQLDYQCAHAAAIAAAQAIGLDAEAAADRM